MLVELLKQSEPLPLNSNKHVRRVKNIMIPMRDGIKLAADLYLPQTVQSGQSLPAVLEYTPYRKDELDVSARRYATYLPERGYLFIRVDVRGTGASEGISKDEYLPLEQQDGYDAIEWIAGQAWCDGHVNMMGISYGGFTCLQVAAQSPPHLTSIIPVDFTDDRYTDECHYRGGLMRLYYDIAFYGGFMVAWNALPPDPDFSGSEWAKTWEQHLAHNEPYLLKWYKHQTDGPYWHKGSVRFFPEKIKCPVFMIGGWRDGYPNPPLRLYQALDVPSKVWIGPWNHAFPDTAIPGPRVEYLQEIVRWLDYWCKGAATGIMDEPPVIVYMQHSQMPVVDRLDTDGTWRAESCWPPPEASETTLYLASEQKLQNAPEEGEKTNSLEYRPDVGVTGGLYSSGIQFGLPGDQRPDEAFSLVYTSQVLNEELTILGRPKVELTFTTTARVIGITVSLCDVAPDGSSHLVCKGTLNATRRESMTEPSPLEPGKRYTVCIDLDCTAWKFVRGNRVRLNIACADWPNIWPTPELCTNTIFTGESSPSKLVLPTVPPEGSAVPPDFLPSPAVVQRHSDSAHPPVWQIIQDVLTGRKTSIIDVRSKTRISSNTVLERRSKGSFEVDPDNPAHASAWGRHIKRIIRKNQEMEACSVITVQATKTHFHITIDLEVKMNKASTFTKRWLESVPRVLL
jgi:putative CocE/NonD family hydrolase